MLVIEVLYARIGEVYARNEKAYAPKGVPSAQIEVVSARIGEAYAPIEVASTRNRAPSAPNKVEQGSIYTNWNLIHTIVKKKMH